MEIEVQRFVSSRNIAREREEVRDARDTVLKDAERKFTARVNREEQSKARGDDKWMLPDLDKQIKKKKKKKHKKEKKSSKNKNSSDESDEWEESSNNKSPTHPTETKTQLNRDDFMEMGFLATYSKKDIGSKNKAKKDQEEADKAKLAIGASRELNPNLRVESAAIKSGGGGSIGVGDGGLSWLLKAFTRAEDQAAENDCTVSDIAEKRWGGLNGFFDLITKAKKKANYIDRKLETELRRIETEYNMFNPADKEKYSKKEERGEINNKDRDRSRDDRIDKGKDDRVDRRERRSNSRERGDGSRDSRERGDRDSRDRDDRRDKSRDDRRDRSRDDRRDRSRDDRRDRSRDGRDRVDRRERSKDRKVYMKERDKSRRSRSNSVEGRRNMKRPQSRSRSRDRMRGSDKRFVQPKDDAGGYLGSSLGSQKEGRGSWKSESRKDMEKQKNERVKVKRKESTSSSRSSSSEKGDNVGSVPDKPPQKTVMSEQELNSLAAKVMKAEIMGNDELAVELRTQLDNARDARSKMIAQGGDPDQKEEVITKVKGLDGQNKKRKKTKVETHKDGERIRYFGDDDRYDIKQLFEREKMGRAEDQQGLLTRLAGNADKTNDDFDVDDMIVSKAAGKQSEEQEELKLKQKAVSEHMALEKTLSDCRYCLGSAKSSKHLMVSIGKSVYLSLPPTTSMAPGHCLIIPMGHVQSATCLDEDVWREIQDFRKALVKMFLAQGEDCVFIETATGFRRHPHMVIECIPVPEDLGSMSPMYFQKAIQECESEWTDNKKLVKLKDPQISKCVPKELPYFHVDFGSDLGFAHVIEDEGRWSRRFGHEVVGGMLDLDPRTIRNPVMEPFQDQKLKVIKFGNIWKNFDWTKSLHPKPADSSDSDSD